MHRFLLFILTLVLAVAGRSAVAQDDGTWILVDTRNMTLSVLEGDTVRRTYKKIAIGRAGTTTDKIQGDDKTPLGEFRLVRIAPNSPFHRFFGIDYPHVVHAERALQAGTIDQEHYAAIRQAFQSNSSHTYCPAPKIAPETMSFGTSSDGCPHPIFTRTAARPSWWHSVAKRLPMRAFRNWSTILP